ncbi:bacterioferritin [Sedimenticola thiotaurini]|uniref:Bacterioferritin n=1 Tax=Sedimenticola thiotaurini TaxID=1543721 RepID=A0A0F7JVY4_9GAMM|nr:bacterioferritin [Sedimenticola thiotaurini]AKH19752.1 bacterioferritin [Sedimenticola thiotaurini]
MQGNKQVIAGLNGALRNQLTAINQFFLHARMFQNWGLGKLNQHDYDWSIKAMKQADALIERILLLEGLPNLQDLGKLLLGEDVQEMLEGDLKLVSELRTGLLGVIALCEAEQDYVSRDLLEDILQTEEAHIDWLESQLWLIGNTGLENYQQSMAS